MTANVADIVNTVFALADHLPCQHCGTTTALIDKGRVIGTRHYEDCPKYDPCCRFPSEFRT